MSCKTSEKHEETGNIRKRREQYGNQNTERDTLTLDQR